MLFQCKITKDSREGQTRGTGQKRIGEGFPYYFHLIFSSPMSRARPRCMQGPEAGGQLSLRPHLAVTGGRGQPRAGGDRAPAPGHVHTHRLVPLCPHLLRPAPDRVASLADSPRHPEAIGWVMTDVTNAFQFSGWWRGGRGKPTSRPLVARHV